MAPITPWAEASPFTKACPDYAARRKIRGRSKPCATKPALHKPLSSRTPPFTPLKNGGRDQRRCRWGRVQISPKRPCSLPSSVIPHFDAGSWPPQHRQSTSKACGQPPELNAYRSPVDKPMIPGLPACAGMNGVRDDSGGGKPIRAFESCDTLPHDPFIYQLSPPQNHRHQPIGSYLRCPVPSHLHDGHLTQWRTPGFADVKTVGAGCSAANPSRGA